MLAVLRGLTVIATMVAWAALSPGQNHVSRDPATIAGQDRFYNLDYAHSIQEFTRATEARPNDPTALNHLATAWLFQELYRMGALNTADYANDNFIGRPRHPASAEAKQKIKSLLDQALRIEEDRLHANERDVDALYARGVTRGMMATYTGLIDRSWFAALRAAMGSRHDHDRVLELSPDYSDAKLVVGTHDYIVGSLPWAVKAAATMIGFSGNKERGLQELRAAAAGGGDASVDAKILLALFLRRERQNDEALKLVREITPRYPQNVIMALEEGNLLRAAGRPAEAMAVYKKVWDAGQQGRYPYGHYEQAVLSMGDLQRSQHDYTGALASYSLIDRVQKPDVEMRQRANLCAGEINDLLNKRDEAVRRYRAAADGDGSSDLAETARKRLQEPYRE